jgi:hypothetical protein
MSVYQLWLMIDNAHYRFIVTFRDPSRKLDFAILVDSIYTPCRKSAPQEVTKSQ